MPIFEFSCTGCGKDLELLVSNSESNPVCPDCGSNDLKKKLSVPSAASGVKSGGAMPEAAGCCGVNPGQAGCAGPGSCCGRNMAMP